MSVALAKIGKIEVNTALRIIKKSPKMVQRSDRDMHRVTASDVLPPSTYTNKAAHWVKVDVAHE
ncbi:hypothetical protein N7475_007550 [Penicillium sp. IBT 31633x]|nr:hypothetical protein N7475_007550 [Penicillium sp. IBT 31633x]